MPVYSMPLAAQTSLNRCNSKSVHSLPLLRFIWSQPLSHCWTSHGDDSNHGSQLFRDISRFLGKKVRPSLVHRTSATTAGPFLKLGVTSPRAGQVETRSVMLASWSGAACAAAVCEPRLDLSAAGPAGARCCESLVTDSTHRRSGGKAASEQRPGKLGKPLTPKPNISIPAVSDVIPYPLRVERSNASWDPWWPCPRRKSICTWLGSTGRR